MGSEIAADLIFDNLLMNYAARPGRQARWNSAPLYILRHITQHAADAGRVNELLSDLEFVIHADPETLSAVLPMARSEAAIKIATVYGISIDRHRVVDPWARRKIMAIDAARYGAASLVRPLAANGVLEACNITWMWKHEIHTGTRFGPVGMAYSIVGDHRAVVVGWSDGLVQLLDADTGQLLRGTDTGTDSVFVACAAIAGHPSAVIGDGEDIWTWDLITGELRAAAVRIAGCKLNALECTLIAERNVAVTGWSDGTVQLLDLRTFLPLGDRFQCHDGPVCAIACGTVHGQPVTVTSGSDGMVNVLDLRSDGVATRSVSRLRDPASAVLCAVIDSQESAVLGRSDGVVEILNLADNELLGNPLIGHTGVVRSLTCTVIKGHQLLCSGGDDGAVYIWDTARPPRSDTIPLPTKVSALAADSHGAVFVGFDGEVIALRFSERPNY